jgi:hypothetical protein
MSLENLGKLFMPTSFKVGLEERVAAHENPKLYYYFIIIF